MSPPGKRAGGRPAVYEISYTAVYEISYTGRRPAIPPRIPCLFGGVLTPTGHLSKTGFRGCLNCLFYPPGGEIDTHRGCLNCLFYLPIVKVGGMAGRQSRREFLEGIPGGNSGRELPREFPSRNLM